MNDQEEFDTETEQNIILTDADLRQLSPLDWARYGTNRIAYMRPVTVNNQRAIAIHAARGTGLRAWCGSDFPARDGCGAGPLTGIWWCD